MSPSDLYVIYRQDGMSDEDAAKKAGFSGRPSPRARRLWAIAEKFHDIPEGALDRYQERIKDAEIKVREMKDIFHAARLIEQATA